MDIGGESALTPGSVDHNDGDQRSNLNISDVFEAISIADPSFGAGAGVEDGMYQPAAAPAAPALAQPARPYVRFVEQPASKALRFRYECEGRSAGSIPGVNSTPERKTYPTIEICGYKGRAIVVVSCVTKDSPYKAHPHNLVGREHCKKGVCTVHVDTNSSAQVAFSNLGIQCVKRKDIADALRVREEYRVDPFKHGFSHKNNPQSIDLNAVRLCFQVFIPDANTHKIRHALHPVVSDVIYDKKAMSDLNIMRLSQCSGSVRGGTELILLCEKVTREDIAVVFVEREGERVVWEEPANVLLVHKQVAIAFSAPPFRLPHSDHHHKVYIQLKRQSDDARSPEMEYTYIPEYADDYLQTKKRKANLLSSYLQSYDQDRAFKLDPIKSEPKDKTPPHQMSSPPLQVYPPQFEHESPHYQQWIQGGLTVPGPSHIDPWTGANYAQPISPNMQVMSPNMQAMSPVMQAVSPGMQAMSPNMQAMSPGMQAMSPMAQVQAMSPMHGGMSPNMGHVSPNLGHVSPNVVQQQHLTQLGGSMQMAMDTSGGGGGVDGSGSAGGGSTLSGLLEDRGEGLPSLNSSELSTLQQMLAPEGDALGRLSSGDLHMLHTHLH